MLSSISWSQFLSVTAVLLLLYYTVVVYFCYRKDIAVRFQRKGNNQGLVAAASPVMQAPGSLAAVTDHHRYEPTSAKEKDDLFPSLQSFTDEVKAYLQEADEQDLPKEIILQCLSVILSKYPGLVASGHRDDLERWIISEAEVRCEVNVSENEASRLWQVAE